MTNKDRWSAILQTVRTIKADAKEEARRRLTEEGYTFLHSYEGGETWVHLDHSFSFNGKTMYDTQAIRDNGLVFKSVIAESEI